MSSNLIMFDDVTVCEETLCILQRSLGPALTFICRCKEGKASCKQPSDPLHEYIRGSSSAMFFGRHGAPGVRSSLASHQCSLKIFSSFQRRAQNHSAFSGCSYSPAPQAFHLSSVAASTIHSHSVTLLLTAIWAYPNTVQLTKVPPKACNFCGCGDMLVPLPSPSNTTHPLDSVTHTSPKKEGRG